MAQEIQVPVRLKVLQDSIQEFQKVLNNLQPNTANWRTLSKLINNMSTEAQKLQAQLSTPFSSEKQFTQTSRTIDKLEEAAARISVVMSSLKFSDIKLTPEQTQEIAKFEDEINRIREAYIKLEQEVKNKITSNSNNSQLLTGINANLLSKDFNEIEQAVDRHVASLESKVADQKAAFNKLKSNIELGMKATALTSSDKGLTREALGDTIFDKFLSATSNGLRLNTFNTGVTKQALLTEIEKMFSLTPGELQGLADKTINQINEAFQNMGKKGNINIFSGIIKRGNDASKNSPLKNEELNELSAQLEEYKRLQSELETLRNTQLTPVNTADTAKITEIQGKLDTLRQSILANIGANSGYNSSMQSLIAQFPQLRTVLESTNAEFLRMQQITNTFNNLKMAVANFMGFTQVLNLTKRAIREAANHIKELDTVMNKISIVTNMDTSDLWNQIESYSKMAQSYGTSIKGAYEVSQIYYQQGLDTTDVLTLTNETLKLAKVSGLDYAQTTDYMTTALRGFKMEMSDAATVVDVYSNLAAHTAVTQEELAVAMSKTASSLESVGTTFKEASAMISTMVAVTRESATNIGSAMKSIAARYGEMKSDPTLLVDSEGQALSYNKVDTALQSVGITLKTTEGQFRSFTDVIIELGEKWGQLDSTQQRYIATQFAGNRQQSRFLALISNIDLLKSNLGYAEESEDVGTLQAIKALDSLESKIEQVRVAYQQFYTTIGAETAWKGFLDITKNVINTLNGMPKLFGTIPVGALNAIAQVISLIKVLGQHLLSSIASLLTPALKSIASTLQQQSPVMQQVGSTWLDRLNAGIKSKIGAVQSTAAEAGRAAKAGFNQGAQGNTVNSTVVDGWVNRLSGTGSYAPNESYKVAQEIQNTGKITQEQFNIIAAGGQPAIALINQLRDSFIGVGTAVEQNSSKFSVWATNHSKLASNLQGIGSALSLVSLAINTTTQGGKRMSGMFQGLSGAVILTASVMKAFDSSMKSIPWMAIASGVLAIVNGISQLAQANSAEARLEELTAAAEKLNNEAKELKVNYKTLDNSISKYKELEESRYDSSEAAEEYATAVEQIAEAYPALVESYNANNEAILNVNAMEEALTTARQKSAEATYLAAQAEALKLKTEKTVESNKLHTEDDDLDGILSLWNRVVDLTDGRTDPIDARYFKGRKLTNYDDKNTLIALTEAVQEVRDAAEENNADKVIQAYENLNTTLKAYDLSMSDELQAAIGKTVNQAYRVNGYDAAIDSANLMTTSYYMNKKYGLDENSIFSQNESLLNIATNQLYKNLKWGNDYSEASLMEGEDNLEFKQVDTFWQSLTKVQQDALTTILENTEQYTQADIEKALSDARIQEIPTFITNYFKDQVVDNVSAFKSKIENEKKNQYSPLTDEALSEFELGEEQITLAQRNLLNAGFKQAKGLSKIGQDADKFSKNFRKFYDEVSSQSADVRQKIIEQILSNGFTKEGLIKTLNYINDSENGFTEFNTETLETLIGNTISNVQLALEVATSDLTDNLDKLESVTSSLQSGVKGSKLEKTISEAKALGLKITRDDFEQDGDKFIIKYNRLQEELGSLNTQYKSQFNNMESNLDKALSSVLKSSDNIEDAQLILGQEDFQKYYTQVDEVNAAGEVIGYKWVRNDKSQEEFETALQTGHKNAVDALQAYFNFLDTVTEQMQKTAAWKNGDYSSLTTLGLGVQYFNKDQSYIRIQHLASHPEDMTPEELDTPDVINAVETYQKGISSLVSDITKYNADYIRNRAHSYEGVAANTITTIADLLDNGTLTVIQAIKTYGAQAGKTVYEINDLIVESLTKTTKAGAAADVAGLISGNSFTGSDLSSFIKKYLPESEADITNFIGENGELTNSALSSVYQLDEATGKYKQIKDATLKQVIAAWSEALGTDIEEGTELYDEVLSQWVSDTIKDVEKKDEGKQASNIISNILSGKVGSYIDTSTSKELEAILGTQATHYYEITSEYARDMMIMSLDATKFDEEYQKVVLDAQDSLKSKYSKSTVLGNIIGETVSQDIAKSWALILNKENNPADAMAELRYVWSDSLNAYVAGAESVALIEAQIEDLQSSGANDPGVQQKINELQQKLNTLKNSNEKKNYDSLKDIISNYKAVSDEMITNLADSLKKPREDLMKYFTSNGNGTYTTDISSLITDIQNGTITVSNKIGELLDTTVQETLTSYYSGIDSQVSAAFKASKSAEIKGQASALYARLTETQRKAFNITSVDQLYEYNAEQGGYVLSELGKHIQLTFARIDATTTSGVEEYIDATLEELMNFDFSSIVAGTVGDETYTRNKLQTLLKEAGINIEDTAMETIYNDIKDNKWDSWNKAVKNLPLLQSDTLFSSATFSGFAKTNYEQYTSALTEAYEKPMKAWSEATKNLYRELGATTGTEFITKLNDNLDLSSYESQTERETRHAKLKQKSGSERAQKAFELTKGGSFSADQLKTYLNENYFGESIEQYWDGSQWIGEAATYLKDQWELQDGVIKFIGEDLAEGQKAFSNAFKTNINTASQAAEKAKKEVAATQATELNENQDVFSASQIKDFASAAVGTYVSLYNVPDEIKAALSSIEGIEQEGSAFRANTERARVQAIQAISNLQLDESYSQTTKALEDANAELNKTYSQEKVYKSLMTGNVDKETAKVIGYFQGWGETEAEIATGMETLGYYWDTLNSTFINQGEQTDALAEINKWLQEESKLTIDEKNAATQDYRNLTSPTALSKQVTAFSDILSNVDTVTEDQIRALATSLGITSDKLSQFFTENLGTDTFKFDTEAFLRAANTGTFTNWNADVIKAVAPKLGIVLDNIVDAVKNAASYMFDGTDSQEAMKAFTKEFQELTGNTATQDELFKWDTDLNKYVLSLTALQEYKAAKIAELIELKVDPTAAKNIVDAQTKAVAAASVDLAAYRDSERKDTDSQAYKTVYKQLKNYYAQLDQFQAVEITDAMPPEAKAAIEAHNEALPEALEAAVAADLETISKGGPDAVKKAAEIAAAQHKDLSAEEMQEYYSPLAKKYVSLAEQLPNLVVGQYVGDGDLKDILSEVDAIDDNGLVTSLKGVVSAYKQIYEKMKNDTNATQSQLNTVYAQYLTASEQSEVDAISTLSDAMGMSYDSLSILITKYGINGFNDLKYAIDNMDKLGLEQIGNGKVRIKDWDAFAANMNWEVGSEEYTNALNSYRDSWIELQKHTSDNITNQLKNVISGQVGDQINITYIEDAFTKLNKNINDYIEGTGNYVENGILNIYNSAAIPDIVRKISSELAASHDLIPEAIAELQDAVVAALKAITDSITNGISGSLSHADFADLQNWANNLNLGKLDFTETENGVKLTTETVNKLYVALKKVNKEGSKSLLSSIKDTKDEYSSYISVLSEISQTTSELNSAYAAQNTLVKESNELYGNTEGITSRTAALQDQLTVLTDIASTLMTTPDAWNFMDNDLPDGIQSVVNIWENGSDAITALKDASTKGYIAVEDWYNIVTTASALTEAAGREFNVKGKTAAELINEGLQNIKIVGGEAQVDLSGTGMNFTAGINDLKSNITSGINDLAAAEIEILDAEIAVFEVLAAMEALGDVDVDMDGISFEIEDIFDTSSLTGATTGAEQFSSAFQTYLDVFAATVDGSETLTAAAKSFKINGTDFYTLIHSGWKTWYDAGFTVESISSLFSRLSTMDWSEDLSQIGSQLLSVFSDLNLNLTVDTDNGFISITPSGQWITVDLSDAEVAKAAANALGDSSLSGENLKKAVRNAWSEYTKKDFWTTDTLEWDTKASYAATVAIATGKLTFTSDSTDSNATGTYNGRTFKGTKEQIYENVAKAMALEDQGYSFEVDASGTKVTGTYKVGNIVLKLDFDSDGNIVYSADGFGETTNKNEIYKWLAEKGQANESMAGTSYTIDGKTYTVAYNAGLKIAYTIVRDENNKISGYKYNDKDYNTPEQIADAVAAESLLADGGYWPDTSNTDSNLEIHTRTIAGVKSEITYNKSEHTWTYKYGNQEFKTAQDYADYISAVESADVGGNIETNGIVTFSFKNQSVTVEVTSDGTLNYTCNVGDKGTVTAHSQSELELAIATMCKLYPDVVDASGQPTATIEYNNQTVTITWNADGTVDLDEDSKKALGDKAAAVIAAATEAGAEASDSTSTDQPITITASSVTVTLTEGATAQIGGEATPSVPVDELQVKPEKISLDPSMTQGGNLQLTETIDSIEGEATVLKIKSENIDLKDAEDKIKELEEKVEAFIEKSPVDFKITVDEDESGIQGFERMTEAADNLDAKNPQIEVTVDPENKVEKEQIPALTEIINQLSSLPQPQPTVDLNVDEVSGQKDIIQNLINSIQGTTVPITLSIGGGGATGTIASAVSSAASWVSSTIGNIWGGNATGNVGLANAKGTLMGELGPELVVSNGKYFVAGQSGAEFVNLSDDAIVFNHLQTQQLLKNGMSSSRGQAVTSERKAVAYATGNMTGPAMASASAILAKLKELRSMWASLTDASVSDLAGTGGSGGGGSDNDASGRSSYIADVERWYNWLQKIAQLEEQITIEEKKRSKISSQLIADGESYAKSNLASLKYLKEQAVTNQALLDTQKEYFEKRRAELNAGAFNKLYTFDQNGQLKYNDEAIINGNKGGYTFLADLFAVNDYGEPKYSSEEQYNLLQAAGFGSYMKYDSSGNEITLKDDATEDETATFYSNSVQALMDLIDSQKEEMQSLHDSILDYEEAVLEDQEAANEILKEIEDNQISVEERVFNALVDKQQRAIDELQNERDAIEESAQAVIDGLSNQLAKEREMYNTQENQDELTSLQRQLNILQRSGGSAAQIASLQKEISSKQKDAYFEAQQAQIDALQEASDNELERLDQQIDLMTETLAYQKDNGLLWEEVYEQMQKSPEEIADYIFANDSSLWGNSPTKTTQDYREALFEAQQFVTYRDNITDGLDKLAETFSDYAIAQAAKEEEKNKIDTYVNSDSGSGGSSNNSGGSSSSSNSGGSSNTGGSSSNTGGSPSKSNNSTTWKYDDNVSGRMYEVDSSGKKTGAIKYDDTGLKAASTTTLNAARNRVITTEEKKIEESKTTLTNAVKSLANSTSELKSATTFSEALSAATKVATAVATGKNAAKQISSSTSTINAMKKAINGSKAEGGYVNHGIYELGELGTETVLTAEQTKVLRDNILSNRPNSLISLLKSYNEGYNGINDSLSNTQQTNDNSVVIEQAIVEMHVEKMNNDYDAQRAGEQALEKMLSIARKTSGQNRIGR